jgi:hypothetical protein
MRFACYSWDALPDSANALFAEAARDSVFFSRPWFENLVETSGEGYRSFLVACVVDGTRVLAALPLIRRGSAQWHAVGHLYSSLSSVLVDRHATREVFACLVEGLRKLPLESLRIAPVDEADRNVKQLQETMEAAGFSCDCYFRFYNWVHRLRGQTFQDYMATRPARVRNTILRKQRKLDREHGYQVRIYTDDDLQRGLEDYRTVYNASWKAKELFDDFIDGLARRLSDSGWLRLAVLYIAERPVAAQFWFVAHGRASIFKLAYDQEWKQYSPGSILTSHLMRHAIDADAVTEIDFLTGNDAYKQDWMTERRERQGLYCAFRRPDRTRLDRLKDACLAWLARRQPPPGDGAVP